MSVGARMRKGAAILAVFTAGIATLATSRAAPTATAETSFAINVEADSNVGSGWLHLSVPDGNVPPAWFDLTLSTGDDGPLADRPHSLSVFDAEAGARQPLDPDYGGLQSVSLAQMCRDGCEKSLLVVARRSERNGPLSAVVDASVAAYFEHDPGPIGLSIEDVGPVSLVAAPATITASLMDTISVDATVGRASWNGTLTVTAEALPESKWVFGSLIPTGTLTISDGSPLIEFNVRVGTADTGYTLFDGGEFSGFETDWSAQCQLSAPCTLLISIEFVWFTPSDERPPPGGTATASFILEATLNYLDRTDTPPGAAVEIVANQ